LYIILAREARGEVLVYLPRWITDAIDIRQFFIISLGDDLFHLFAAEAMYSIGYFQFSLPAGQRVVITVGDEALNS